MNQQHEQTVILNAIFQNYCSKSNQQKIYNQLSTQLNSKIMVDQKKIVTKISFSSVNFKIIDSFNQQSNMILNKSIQPNQISIYELQIYEQQQTILLLLSSHILSFSLLIFIFQLIIFKINNKNYQRFAQYNKQPTLYQIIKDRTKIYLPEPKNEVLKKFVKINLIINNNKPINQLLYKNYKNLLKFFNFFKLLLLFSSSQLKSLNQEYLKLLLSPYHSLYQEDIFSAFGMHDFFQNYLIVFSYNRNSTFANKMCLIVLSCLEK
ncbi:hypothetical protein ABPG72_000425 [Tetrahymena utriculariae]